MSDEQLAALEEQKKNCIFCKIIAKEIPSHVPYEDDDFLAIMDIRPATKGHVLLMPKEHFPILPVVPQDKLTKLFSVIKKLSNAIQKASFTNSTTIFFANGGAAGQMSPHFILHIVPRESGDMLPLDAIKLEGSEADMNKITKALQARFTPVQKAPNSLEERDPIADLADALQANPEVKKLIIEDPEKFKDYVKANPQLEGLFNQIDVHKLSEQLKNMETKVEPDKTEKEKVVEENLPKATTEPEKIESVFEEEKVEETKPIPETKPVEKDEEPKKKKEGADLDKIGNLFK